MCISPLKVVGEDSSLLLLVLVAPGIPWLMGTSLHCLPLSSHGLFLSVCVSSSSVSFRTLVIEFRAYLDNPGG